MRSIPQERIQQRTVEEIVDVRVPQIQEQIVEVIKVILQGAVSANAFFLLRACGEGAVGCTGRAC